MKLALALVACAIAFFANTEGNPCPCTFDINPVCGADGIVYVNNCTRTCEGVEFAEDNSVCEDHEDYGSLSK